MEIKKIKQKYLFQPTCLVRVLTFVCKVSCHCVAFREERERESSKQHEHVSGPSFHTQVDGHRWNVVQCACHVGQNGVALQCEIVFCHTKYGASAKHHPLCVHASHIFKNSSVATIFTAFC